jgi:hypothetical protein
MRETARRLRNDDSANSALPSIRLAAPRFVKIRKRCRSKSPPPIGSLNAVEQVDRDLRRQVQYASRLDRSERRFHLLPRLTKLTP